MKKLLVLCLTAVLCLCCLASCGSAHKENEWFSEEKLTECLVGDLPTIEKDYVNHNGEDIYVSFTSKEREAYVAEVFEYLKSQNFKYLGTRGEQASTLAGSFTTYYFKPATELSEFYVSGSYKFVYSDGALDEDGDLVFCIINIYDYEAKNLEYGTKNFAYNTLITLRYKQEAPLSGRYALNEEEQKSTINIDFGTVYSYSDYPELGEKVCEISNLELEFVEQNPFIEIDPGHVIQTELGNFDIYDMDLFMFEGKGYRVVTEGFSFYELFETMPEIPTPTNHFLRNHAGCEWLNEITAEDIAKIKIISGAVGVAPGNLNNVSSSTDEAVIARIFEEYYWLDTAPISKMEGQIDGGGGVTVKFILKDGTAKELYINNGNYLDTNGDYFELLSTPKFKDTDNATKAYGFITYLGTGTVYDKDNNSVCEIPIDELEFVESDGCVDAMVTGYYYTVETEFGTLYFDYSNDLFYLQFEEGEVDYIEYYQLVGKNLDELIAEYSITTE